jgi:hypothetical protein
MAILLTAALVRREAAHIAGSPATKIFQPRVLFSRIEDFEI